MEQIASFTIDHNRLQPGMYLARRDGDIVTLDLRFKKPNMVATALRNGEAKEAVIYFGPMGCQTGFFFLFDERKLTLEGAVALMKKAFAEAAAFEGEMPGKSPIECGNYINLDVETGRAVCRWYSELIRDWTVERLSYDWQGK